MHREGLTVKYHRVCNVFSMHVCGQLHLPGHMLADIRGGLCVSHSIIFLLYSNQTWSITEPVAFYPLVGLTNKQTPVSFLSA